uniref:RING-type domain-containing protein n=1 Tax=Sus scrofa TaxID=9823 RepID=A0A8D1GPW8_PIG
MAQAASLAQLQAEASCPICLDYLQDPVTTDCGHNFCHSCLLQRWEGLQGDFPCPVCLQHCPDRSLRRNTQLCHMVDVVKQLPNMEGEGKQQEEKALCLKQHQVLSLFCEEDLELLSAACHRRRLKGSIEPLKEQHEVAKKALEMQVSKTFDLMREVQKQRSKLTPSLGLGRGVLTQEDSSCGGNLPNHQTPQGGFAFLSQVILGPLTARLHKMPQ